MNDFKELIDRLIYFENIVDGWHNGYGETFSRENLDWLIEQIEKYDLFERRIPAVFPTPEGEIQFEFRSNYIDEHGMLLISCHKKEAAWLRFNFSIQTGVEDKIINLNEDGWYTVKSYIASFCDFVEQFEE